MIELQLLAGNYILHASIYVRLIMLLFYVAGKLGGWGSISLDA